MRRGYCLQEHDEEYLVPIMEGLVWRLEQKDINDIELSVINLGPSQFMYLLECLGYERDDDDDDWDSNGWEQDTWHYYKKEGHPSLTLYYCGYDGEIKLYLREGEEYEDNN